MRIEAIALTALCASSARAAESPLLAAERFSLALPVEAHAIGAAVGLHPEVHWRPFAADGVMNVVASVGFLPGSEYIFVPVDLGARWTWRPWRFFQPSLGVGLEAQTFLVSDGGPFARAAVYTEFGTHLGIDEHLRVGVMVVPSLAPFGVPGPGLAGRLTLTWDLGAPEPPSGHPAEASPAEESAAEESAAEESPAEASPAEESPAEESPAEESPAAAAGEGRRAPERPDPVELGASRRGELVEVDGVQVADAGLD